MSTRIALRVAVALVAVGVSALWPSSGGAALPGTNGLIVCGVSIPGARVNGLYVANPAVSFRSNQAPPARAWRKIPNTKTGDGLPAWAPSGNRVAFVHRTGARTGTLTLIRTDGKNRKPLTSASPVQPAWSPDGSKIAFQRGTEIWIKTVGGGETRLTVGNNPSWSPDGQLIAFDRAGALWTIAPDGSGEMQIPAVALESGTLLKPAWSPDGRSLLAIDNGERRLLLVYSVDDWSARAVAYGAEFSPQEGIVDLPSQSSRPTWSPDSSTIVWAYFGLSFVKATRGPGITQKYFDCTDLADWHRR